MIKNIPAVTIVAEWSKALTGVGATIAPGNQTWKGINPALAKPKRNSNNKQIIINLAAVLYSENKV